MEEEGGSYFLPIPLLIEKVVFLIGTFPSFPGRRQKQKKRNAG
jgi:hypothetical protein